MGKGRRRKPLKQSSVGLQRDGTSCSTPVAGQGCGEKAAAEGEGEGASPQRKRQRISRGKGRSNRSVSAWREVKEGRSDAEGSLVAGVPDGVQSSNGQGSCRGNAPVSVPVTCSDAVPSSHGNTMDGSVPSQVVSSNVSPIRSDAGMDLSTSRCDSDSDSGDDDDLPSVSVSFGTPSHNGVAFDGIVEGAVYWLVYPHYPPWPAVAVSKSHPKARTVQALFFSDITPDIKRYAIKIKGCSASPFSEVATERDKFMAEKVEPHKRYQVFKKCIEAAVEDAKLYITRKDELSATLSPTDLFDSITRRRITEVVRPEGETTPKIVRNLKFFPEASEYIAPSSVQAEVYSTTDSECGSHNEEEEDSEGNEEEEGSSRASRMVGVNADRRTRTACLYSNQYCTRFLKRKTVKEALKGIMERSVPSKRHDTFFSGSNSERLMYRYSSFLGPLEGLTMVQREKIVDKLKGFVLQWKHETDTFQEVSYTFDVLLPEAIIRMIADVEKVPLDAAEQKYCNWYSHVSPGQDE